MSKVTCTWKCCIVRRFPFLFSTQHLPLFVHWVYLIISQFAHDSWWIFTFLLVTTHCPGEHDHTRLVRRGLRKIIVLIVRLMVQMLILNFDCRAIGPENSSPKFLQSTPNPHSKPSHRRSRIPLGFFLSILQYCHSSSFENERSCRSSVHIGLPFYRSAHVPILDWPQVRWASFLMV